MKLTVLVDNNTLIDRYFLAEPGLSFLIEDGDTVVLFDTGYSDIFLKNAWKIGLSLTNIDYLVLSHGHLDHTWGLEPLIKYFTELTIEKINHSKPVLVAHPQIFTSVAAEGFAEFGTLMSKEKLAKHFQMNLTEDPLDLNERLVFLGQIPRLNNFESVITFGRKDGEETDDIVIEDSALVYKAQQGLVIMTGCSHSGICNIIEYAKEVCSENRILDVIGGFHLLNPSKEQLKGTLTYFKGLHPNCIHACHCTDLQSKIALSTVVDIQEIGVGATVAYD